MKTNRRIFLTGTVGSAILLFSNVAQASRLIGASVATPSGPTIIMPPTGWNGTTGSGFSVVPTASTTPHGTGLDTNQISGGFTWQQSLEVVEDNSMIGMIHGGVGADPINGRLNYVEIYLESSTPYVLSNIEWVSNYTGFGIPISIRTNDKCGIAQGYIRSVPVNGLERVDPFTVWLNGSTGVGKVNRGDATHAGYVDPATGVDDTSHGTQASPWATLAYGLTRMQGAREGGYLYLVAGTHNYITTTPPTAPTITFPCEVRPVDGLTAADVTIKRITGRGPINIQCQKVVFKNVTFDCSTIDNITGAYTSIYFRNTNLIDPNWSTGFNGVWDTWGGTSFPQYYYSGDTSNNFITTGNATRYVGAIDCQIALSAITSFRKLVNITGPGGNIPAKFCWDCFNQSVTSVNEIGSATVFNYVAQQVGPARSRLHSDTELAVDTAIYNSPTSGKTTITFLGGIPTGWVVVGQDAAALILEGPLKGDTNPSATQSGTGYFTTSGGALTLVGDYSSLNGTGYKIRVYNTGHPDSFQTSFSSSVLQTRPGLENLYFQRYIVEGITNQLFLIQGNAGSSVGATFTSTGTTLTASAPVTLYQGSSIHVTGTHNYAMIAADGTATTTFTLYAPFVDGDISGATCSVGSAQNNTYMVNCILDKSLVDTSYGQLQNAISSFGHLGCTFLGSDNSGSNRCVVFRPTQSGYAVNGWSAKGCIFSNLATDGTGPFPTAQIKADYNHFITNGSPPVGTNSTVGAVTINLAGNYYPTSWSGAVCDTNIVAAAPFDADGNARRIGDPVGAKARVV